MYTVQYIQCNFEFLSVQSQALSERRKKNIENWIYCIYKFHFGALETQCFRIWFRILTGMPKNLYDVMDTVVIKDDTAESDQFYVMTFGLLLKG